MVTEERAHNLDFDYLYRLYSRHLIDDVVAFWDQRCADGENPGYTVAFDRVGFPFDTHRNVWCQARQTWMFAALYNDIAPRSEWLKLSRRGRDLLVNLAYAGDGRWVYLLDRTGRVVDAKLSWFTDAFAIAGLAEHVRASGDSEDCELVLGSLSVLERNLRDRSFSQFHHHVLDSRYLWHGPHMLGLWLGQVVRKALDTSRADSLIDYCLDLVMQCFADRSSGTISEVIDPDDYTLDSHLARIVNPGHALESCWFCMEEGMRRNDSRLIERATNLCAGSLEVGLDKLHGGVLAFVNRDGTPPIVGKNQWGENWDDKIWWVQAEALYATALGAVLTKNDQLLTTFCELHEYVFRNFWDSLYGEWYPYLSRSNHVRESNKGNWIKSCFHLPRSLMKLTLLFRRLAGEP